MARRGRAARAVRRYREALRYAKRSETLGALVAFGSYNRVQIRAEIVGRPGLKLWTAPLMTAVCTDCGEPIRYRDGSRQWWASRRNGQRCPDRYARFGGSERRHTPWPESLRDHDCGVRRLWNV